MIMAELAVVKIDRSESQIILSLGGAWLLLGEHFGVRPWISVFS